MIKRYNDFFTNEIIENENIIIEITNEKYYHKISESFNFSYYDRNKRLDNTYTSKLKKIEKSIEDYLEKINPFKGKHLDERTGDYRYINFDIVPTEHFYTKFFRKDFEDITGSQNLVNPKPSDNEGIRLIKNNIDFLTKKILDGTIKHNTRFIVKSKDSSTPEYTLDVSPQKVSKGIYHMVLISQLKGRPYKHGNMNNNIRKFKLHPNGPPVVNKKPT